MDGEKIIKSNQEQALGAWIDDLNQARLNELIEALKNQERNFEESIKFLNDSVGEIHKLIESNRGGRAGMHGFIAEIAECGIGNARRRILGKEAAYKWINDNGSADLQRDGILIQQKFVQAGFSLNAVAKHLKKYPDFLKTGKKYQIPEDYYKKVIQLLNMSEKEANRLPSNGELTLRDWKLVHQFFEKNDINSLEPSLLSYDAVQVNQIDDTMNMERKNIEEINDKRRNDAYQKSEPNLQEGLKATAWSAVIEGGTTFALSISRKIKLGKPLRTFTEDDWKDIINDTGKGSLKGGIRGAGIYLFTNYTATSGSVASGVATASFGIAEQAHLFRKGQTSEVEFIENSEMIALDAAVSALSSLVGQVAIPIPVLGAIIGNSVGMIMYQTAKDNFSDKEKELIKKYIENQQILDRELSIKYTRCINELSRNMQLYLDILENAFSPDAETAFNGSINLCVELGVPMEEILDTKEKIDTYFLG